MEKLDPSALQSELTALKERAHRERRSPSEDLPPIQDEFRNAIARRRSAWDLLGAIGQPYTPTYVALDKPFLIWANRYGRAADILVESHIEPWNSWARTVTRAASESAFMVRDEVSFYFLWQNETGSDVVLNVESYLMLNGWCQLTADSGWIWSPFWGQGTIGKSRLAVDAELALLEWWNQPPTQPAFQSGQIQNVLKRAISGGFAFGNPGKTDLALVTGNHHLNYDLFHVPRDAAVVFEVALSMSGSGSDGSVMVRFDGENALILCPYVQLEVVTGPPGLHP
jgi:hypothetical protein